MAIVPPIQSEDLPRKGYDSKVTRQILRFLVPYKLPLLGAMLLDDRYLGRLRRRTVYC